MARWPQEFASLFRAARRAVEAQRNEGVLPEGVTVQRTHFVSMPGQEAPTSLFVATVEAEQQLRAMLLAGDGYAARIDVSEVSGRYRRFLVDQDHADPHEIMFNADRGPTMRLMRAVLDAVQTPTIQCRIHDLPERNDPYILATVTHKARDQSCSSFFLNKVHTIFPSFVLDGNTAAELVRTVEDALPSAAEKQSFRAGVDDALNNSVANLRCLGSVKVDKEGAAGFHWPWCVWVHHPKSGDLRRHEVVRWDSRGEVEFSPHLELPVPLAAFWDCWYIRSLYLPQTRFAFGGIEQTQHMLWARPAEPLWRNHRVVPASSPGFVGLIREALHLATREFPFKEEEEMAVRFTAQVQRDAWSVEFCAYEMTDTIHCAPCSTHHQISEFIWKAKIGVGKRKQTRDLVGCHGLYVVCKQAQGCTRLPTGGTVRVLLNAARSWIRDNLERETPKYLKFEGVGAKHIRQLVEVLGWLPSPEELLGVEIDPEKLPKPIGLMAASLLNSSAFSSVASGDR